MNRAIRLLVSVLLLVILAPSVAFSAPPKGAVKLAKSKLVRKDGFFCGNIKGKTWAPGRRISGGYFYSYQAERTNLRGQLKRASKKNRAKIRGQIDALTSLIAARSAACATGLKKALRFNFSGAVGLTLSQATGAASRYAASSGSSSNLNKVDGAGKQYPAVTSGSATISRFLIAPNDKLYVLFDRAINLSNTSAEGQCLLAGIDRATGIPECLETELESVGGLISEHSGRDLQNAFVQFDSTGTIYYSGTLRDGRVVLRKNDGVSRADLIADRVALHNFLVLSDGTIIISGRTRATNARWLRRISPGGSLSNLRTAVNNTFMKVFPDGNVYLGFYGPNAVERYFTSTDSMDDVDWINYSNATNSISSMCAEDTHPFGFCSYSGGYAKGLFNLPNGRVYAVSGIDSSAQLVQYYPTVEFKNTAVSSISVMQRVISQIVLAGLNSSQKNILTLFNTADDSEVELLGANNEIEIYHLNYVATTNSIMFDGLRFSDNKYVIGRYDLNTMSFSASQTGSNKLVDFQTF